MGNKEQLERILYNVYTTGYYNALYERGIDNINWDKVFKELEEALNTDASNSAPSEYDPLEDSDDPRTMNLNNG